MAGSGSDTTTDGDGAAFLISPRRKVEIFGLVLMVLALLLSLAFVSYHAGDAAVLRSAQLSEVLVNPQDAPTEVPVQNVLGLIGAQLAQGLVPGFIGYGVLLLSSLLMVWGYAIFRHSSLRRLLYPSTLTVLSAFVLSCLLGWFDHTLEASLTAWAGAVGIGTAGWMQNVFGEVGSLILLLLSVAVMLLLVVDHDIQRTVDRGISAVHAIMASVASAGAYVKRQWAQARAQANTTTKERSSATSTEASTTSASSDAAPSDGPTRRDFAGESSARPSPSSQTFPSPAPTSEDRPVRRNDLFRTGDAPATSSTDEETDAPSGREKDSDTVSPEERTAPQPSPPTSEEERETQRSGRPLLPPPSRPRPPHRTTARPSRRPTTRHPASRWGTTCR